MTTAPVLRAEGVEGVRGLICDERNPWSHLRLTERELEGASEEAEDR